MKLNLSDIPLNFDILIHSHLGLEIIAMYTYVVGILAGVYILSQNFIIALKRNKCVMKIFIIAPNLHVVHNGISINQSCIFPYSQLIGVYRKMVRRYLNKLVKMMSIGKDFSY